MSRIFPDLDSAESRAYDGIWQVIKSDEMVLSHFRTFVEWDGDAYLADSDIPAYARLPQIRLDVRGNAQLERTFERSTRQWLQLTAVVWSPGWNVRDIWGLSELAKQAVLSEPARRILMGFGVQKVQCLISGEPQVITNEDNADRFLRAEQVWQLHINQEVRKV